MNLRGPFLHSGKTTGRLMAEALGALAPIACAAVWRHGGRGAVLLAGGIAAAWLAELVTRRDGARDGSAPLSGAIAALMLPASAPWSMGALSGAIAILLGKQVWGGLGKNPFNPACLSRAVLMGLFPALFFAPAWPVDGTTRATPLARETGLSSPPLTPLLVGGYPGSLAEAAPLAVLAGGLFLALVKTIDWRVPLAYLGTLACLALVLPPGTRLEGHAPWLAGHPLAHLLAGGSLLAAFFLLTDPVTAPWSPGGRIAFAVLAGALTMLVRYYTLYPDGVALAVLAANAAVPLIDRLTFRRGLA